MIDSDHFVAAFDTQAGRFSLRRRDGTPFLTGARLRLETSLGPWSPSGGVVRVTTHAFRDALGSGRCLRVECREPEGRLDVRLDVALYEHRALATVEVRCANVSSGDVVIRTLEPVRALASEGAALHVPGATACVTNGEMFYDPGELQTLEDTPRPSGPGGLPAIGSWWNVGVASGDGPDGVAVGYLESSLALGRVYVEKCAEGELSLLAQSVFGPGVTLRPGASMASNRFALCTASSAHASLEAYADAVGALQGARTRSIVNGWCSWFYTLTQVSEDEVLRNTSFAQQQLRAYGLEYVQIDDGYQRCHGDWQGNERFPRGLQWLAAEIRARGFKPGLWIAPYVISERSPVFREHPDWLVRRADGSLQRIGNWPSESSPEALRERERHYCLDITHPLAAEWLRELFATIARAGYEMIKIDFVAWSILAAERFHDTTRSAAQVYRDGAAIMRAAVGDACHLLECGPGNVTVGLIDSMRIEADTNYGSADAAWKQYFTDPASSSAAAARRYYFHRRTWINDVDHVCLDLLTQQQAEAVATLVALSGGNTISGDRLVDLEPAKLEVLKKILPAYGDAATPVDLFEAAAPATFVLHVERPFARWTIVALFNADLTGAVERRVPLERLGLDARAEYLAFDFWKARFFGRTRSGLVATLAPGSVTLLALHEATGAPQWLSTSRHVVQGGLELEDARWLEAGRTYSGVSTGPRGSAHDVFVFVPGDHAWTWERPSRVSSRADYSVRLVEANVARVRVRFDERERVAWKIVPDELAF